ncbi:MAG TPA: NnrU family protein [Acidisphaera sp.]|nr:NnrU family protein [Acidisphaera sp.]
MVALALAALLWVVVHVGVAGTRLRDEIAGRLGDGGFRGAFSIMSVIAIALLVLAYNRAPYDKLWVAPAVLRWVLAVVMLGAFVLFGCAVLIRSPTAIGGESELAAEPRGILRVTRHPMLNSFAIWAAVHVLGNGDVASVLFFGAFLVTAAAGMPSIDAKLAARTGPAFQRLAARTSIIPFGAIASGRNRLVVGEIGWQGVLLGVVLWAVLLASHRWIFGVSPLAG